MISLRRIFGLILLFLFFEAVIAVVTTLAYPNVNVFLACVAMTALAVAVWAVFVLVTRVMMRPRVPQPPAMAKPMAPIAAPHRSFGDDSFSQELGSLITEANRRLAGSAPVNAHGELPSVATLPLYLVIGGEGAGKTSAVLNCGLEPRLLAGEATREGTVVPTRLCNLWYAEGAVFADVSGRILMQGADDWERTLKVFSQPSRIPRWKQLLLGRRGQTNLRGLILVCDTGLFTRASDPQRIASMARTLGDRLQSAGAVFRREFPVYVVFSKSDGVATFPEFFAHLGEPETRRVVGATLPLVRQANDTADIYADREGKRLTNYFNRLYMSLAEKRLVFLAREDQPAKKSLAYEFPRELKKLRGDVVQFLLDVFRPNPLQVGPRLRGFYLSGQRWVTRNMVPVAEGTMAGFTVMPKRSDATVFFGSKPDEKPGVAAGSPVAVPGMARAIAKWMFLTDLFHNVILKDRAGQVTVRINTREQVYRNIGFATAGALLLLFSLVWANSWRHNRNLLNDVRAAVDSVHLVPIQAVATADTLAELDSLREPLTRLLDYQRNGAPLSYRWGLYSGHDVTSSLDSLYFDRFRRVFVDPVLELLTTRFMQLDPGNPLDDDVYSELKAYRMITSGTCKPDQEFLSSSLMPVWTSSLSLPSDLAALAERQTQFYLSELMIRNPYEQETTENRKAVAQAQRYLLELNGPDKILRALVEQVDHQKQGEMLSAYAPNYAEVMTGPNSIDAAYTREGWNVMMDSIRDHKLASAGEPCVLGTQSAASNLSVNSETERQVQSLYIDNYIQRWKTFLGGHHVEAFHGTQDAARRLRILADNNRSPLLGLVYMASHNTDLSTAQSGNSAVATVIEQTKESVSKRIKGVLGTKSSAPVISALTPAAGPSASDVVREFGPVRAVVDPASSEKWLNSNNQAYVQGLEELGNSIAAMPTRIDPKDPADQQAMDRANKALQQAIAAHHALGGMLPNTSSQVDMDVKALLWEPITYASAVIKGVPLKPPPPPPPDLTIPIRAQVNKSAQGLCTSVEGLRSKFPFDPAATQEATVQDLNDVFAPGSGALARFAQSPDVSKTYVRQGKAWTPNPSFPGNFSQPFIQELNALSDFSDALYADGTGNPHFDYTLIAEGTGRVPFELNIDGHTLNYNPKKGPVTTRLVWPPVTNAPTRLTVKSGMRLPVQSSGLWSLFRLLQAADKQAGSVFIFSTIQFANGNKVPLQDSKGNPVTIQIRIDSVAANAFTTGYFGKLRCENFTGWALR